MVVSVTVATNEPTCFAKCPRAHRSLLCDRPHQAGTYPVAADANEPLGQNPHQSASGGLPGLRSAGWTAGRNDTMIAITCWAPESHGRPQPRRAVALVTAWVTSHSWSTAVAARPHAGDRGGVSAANLTALLLDAPAA